MENYLQKADAKLKIQLINYDKLFQNHSQWVPQSKIIKIVITNKKQNFVNERLL